MATIVKSDRVDEFGKSIQFEGFSNEGLKFLGRLKRNNRRDWFHPRKREYETLLRKPMQALVLELRDRIEGKYAGAGFDPKRSIMRINRDIRFTEDKAPYKTHIAAHSVHGAAKEESLPGFYVHVAPKEIVLAGGLYSPSSAQLVRIRNFINENPKRFLKIINDPKTKKQIGEMKGERLKRAPRGFLIDNPNLEVLKWKQFYFSTSPEVTDCLKPGFARQAARAFEAMIPLLKWLDEAIRFKVPD